MPQDDLRVSLDVEQQNPALQNSPRFRTLVVDGNFFFSGFLEKFLESEGHFILTAATVKDAIAKTRQFQPDLILLDNELEGHAGPALLAELLLEQASAAVILMARKPSISEAVEAIKLGAIDYFERPLDAQKLKHAIETQKALFKSRTEFDD